MRIRVGFLALLCVTCAAPASELKNLLTDNDMPGWGERYGGENFGQTKTWTVEHGILHCTGSEGGGWWGSRQEYTDFILDFEFKLPPGGNSGVYVRTPKKGHPSFDGMEVQILDDPAPIYKDIEPGQHCGSIYKVAPASLAERKALKPANEWNHMHITAEGDHLTVTLNDVLIVDADGKSHPEILKRSPRGPLGFQNHSTGLWFRNIKLADLAAERMERSKWFRDAKFGMFIHWGVYSVLGEGEWIMNVRKIKAADYEKLPPQFTADQYDPQAWAALAKKAGCKYVVITSKHHDGFDMFASKSSPYNVVDRTPFGKDPLKPLADAVRAAGMHFGFYHSILDWHHPDYAPVTPWDTEARAAHKPDFGKYLDYLQAQVRELCTNYGPLACIWWDGGWDHNNPEDKARFAKIIAMIRELQPGILINNRANLPEDFDTPEQYIPPTGIANTDGSPKLWENCITLTTGHGSFPPSQWWGFDKNEKQFKTPEFCIRMLVDIVSKGGNLLLNVGPDSHGQIGPNETKTLQAMGRWLDVNGDAIYGTTASPFQYLPFYGRATVKGDRLFVHVFAWPGEGRLALPGLKNHVQSARLIQGEVPLKAEQSGGDWILALPETPPDPIASVIELRLDGAPQVEPYVIKPDRAGVVTLPVTFAELIGQHGQQMRLESEGGRVCAGNWTNAKDSLAWKVTSSSAGRYDVVLSYAAGASSAGGAFEVAAGDAKLPGIVEATEGGKVMEKTLGSLALPPGPVSLTLKPVQMPKDAPLMQVYQIQLRPASGK